MQTINSESLEYVQKLVYNLSANVIPDEKTYLIKLRLTPLAREKGFDSVQKLIDELRTRPPTGLHAEAVEAMMNNETSFFRESRSFEAVDKFVLPTLVKARQKERTLNVWSAACSTGQEPYSIAILLNEQLPEITQWSIKIIASEYSKSVLANASQGRYSKLTISRGLPQPMLEKYFDKFSVADTPVQNTAHRDSSEWQVKDRIRKMITFQQLNLAKPWPSLPQMDIIFMRNILIYFDEETKQQILERAHRLLKPDGYLFLGSAETITNLDKSFERIQVERTVAYRRCSHESRPREFEACR